MGFENQPLQRNKGDIYREICEKIKNGAKITDLTQEEIKVYKEYVQKK